MLKAKGNEVLDETGKQLCVVLATSCTKRDAKRWAQYIVDRVNADERGKAFTKETPAEPNPKCRDAGYVMQDGVLVCENCKRPAEEIFAETGAEHCTFHVDGRHRTPICACGFAQSDRGAAK